MFTIKGYVYSLRLCLQFEVMFTVWGYVYSMRICLQFEVMFKFRLCYNYRICSTHKLPDADAPKVNTRLKFWSKIRLFIHMPDQSDYRVWPARPIRERVILANHRAAFHRLNQSQRSTSLLWWRHRSQHQHGFSMTSSQSASPWVQYDVNIASSSLVSEQCHRWQHGSAYARVQYDVIIASSSSVSERCHRCQHDVTVSLGQGQLGSASVWVSVSMSMTSS